MNLVTLFGFYCLYCLISVGHSADRVFYIGIADITWDYAPSGRNDISDRSFEVDGNEGEFVFQGPDRIGREYKKAVYREFTDDTYSQQVPRPEWLGLLGPLMYAEVGDTMTLHLNNMGSYPFTLHPHGVFYTKANEGALYMDGTRGADKKDDGVMPGGNHTYFWSVPERAGPTTEEENCIPWQYHSHIQSAKGSNSGLVGAMIICKKGILDSTGRKRSDVDKDFVLLFTQFDENESYYLDDNIQTYALDPSSVDTDDRGFIISNKMNSINGYVYGNLPGLQMCQGDTVEWYVFAMGSQEDVHTAYFHGNTLIFDGQRVDSLSALPAGFHAATMQSSNPGTWLIASEVATSYAVGGEIPAQALYTVDPSCGVAPDPDELGLTGIIREYFFQAEDYFWNYAPLGKDNWKGIDLKDPRNYAKLAFETGENRIGGTYKKARYRPYTDATFRQPIERTEDEEYLGILGPIIRAEVGDTIRVTFRNNQSRPFSMTAHGVWYDKANEGQAYNDGSSESSDEAIQPGSTYTYTWQVPEFVSPSTNDGQCIYWTYFSSVDPERDVYSGLIGPLLVCRKGTLDDDGEQTGVDKEFAILAMFSDENRSWYLQDNIDLADSEIDPTDQFFIWSNQLGSINGYMLSNIPGLDMCVGDTVSWHLSVVGQWYDPHPIYFRGNTFVFNGRRHDTVLLYPGISETAIMYPDNIGTWSFECQMQGHFASGMQGFYNVRGCRDAEVEQLNGIMRTYYIAVVEREWDYAPVKTYSNFNISDPSSAGYLYTHQGNTTIGSKYKKALYREFTDDSFTVEKVREARDQHLGMLGPFIHAEVGDRVRIVLKNMAVSKSYSIHPHGVLYRKASEGSQYNDGVNDTGVVAPGETYTYNWIVPMRAGPTETESNCVIWSYYSCVDCRMDPYSGLTGPLVICRPGTLGEDGRRSDVDHEFVLQFYIYEEGKSHYFQENIDTYCLTPEAVNKGEKTFKEGNRMHAMNGYVYDNLKHLEMTMDDNVAWYVIGLGNEHDVHPVHFHGQVVTYETEIKHRADVYELLPGAFAVLEMIADDPGEWLVHCHANYHKSAGMETTFKIFEKDPNPSIPDADHECVRMCEWPPNARKCRYVFTVEWLHTMSSACYDCPINKEDCEKPGCIPVNGVARPILTVNRQLPGPAIEVCEGDEIEVKVWNRLGNAEGTSIHWHGIHQRDTPYMDGVTMITQCPISPQSSFTYNFEASPVGTHWWHAHSDLQRADGIYGPLIIKQAPQRDVNSNLYDYDLPEHAVIVQNWLHKPSISNYAAFPLITGATDSQIINGKGVFQGFTNSQNLTVHTPREVLHVVQGKRYRFRVIGNNICSSVVSVQGHVLTVIATDGAPVTPRVVDRIGIFNGESFDFVLTADQSADNYWFRFYSPDPECSSVKDGLAILRYEGSDYAGEDPMEVFSDENDSDSVLLNVRSADEVKNGLTIVELESTVADDEQILGEPDVQHYLAFGTNQVSKWNVYDPQDYPNAVVSEFPQSFPQINHLSFKVPPSPPLTQWDDIEEMDFCEAVDALPGRCLREYCSCTQRIKLEKGEMVELILVAEDDADHQMHIHGHSVRVVATGRPNPTGVVTVEEVMELDQAGGIVRKLQGAVIKDSVNVPGGGYTIVRFVADNPGWWLLQSDGVAVVLEVGDHTDNPPVPDNFPQCGSWAPVGNDSSKPDDKDRKPIEGKKSRKSRKKSL